MGAVVDILAKGGGKTKSVGDVLQGDGAGSTCFRVGDLGDDPPYGTGHWRVSIQGRYMEHWEVSHAFSG